MAQSLFRRLTAVCALFALVACTGCIEIERVIVLKQNLSGTASFSMTMNMEPMVKFIVDMGRSVEGKTGAPTEQEIAEATKMLTEQMNEKQGAQPKLDTASYAAALPAGITLIDVAQKFEGLKMNVHMTLGFDDVRKLPALRMKDPMPAPGADASNDIQPFEGLEIKDEGRTLLITAKGITTGDAKIMAPEKAAAGAGSAETAAAAQSLTDALKEMMGAMGGPDGMQAQMEGMFKGMKEVFRIETPLTVVDTNATTRQAGAVTWEVSFETVLANAKAGGGAPQPPPAMTLRVRK